MKRIIAIVASAVICFSFTACDTDKLPMGEMVTDIIDVGKGDCILIRTENSTMMIDTGYNETADHVKERLDDCKVQKIDALVITHFDKDHMGGALKLIEDHQVSRIYLPDYESTEERYSKLMQKLYEQDIDTERVKENISLTLDNAKVTISPSGCEYSAGSGDEEGNDNDMSLIVSVINGNDSCLFTGDIEEEGIEKYLSRESRHYDILKIPHHGEYSDNMEKLLDSVSPKTAIVTDGDGDKMDKKLKNTLEDREIEYYSTRKDGDITIKSSGKGEYSFDID